MTRGAHGSVYKRCGCRDAVTGKRKGPRCELLRRAGHGSWYLTLEVPPGSVGERRRLRVGGHHSRRQAEKALLGGADVVPGNGDGGVDDRSLAASLASRAGLVAAQHPADV
jgi:hypothetical protein